MISKKKILLFIIFLKTAFNTFLMAQESPYYQLPKNRVDRTEAINMPNLYSKYVQYYFSAAGGMKKNFSKTTLSQSLPISTSTDLTVYWEIAFGQTRNHNYFWEIGLIKNPMFIRTDFSAINNTPFPLIFRKGDNFYGIPLRFKKRIFTFDKIANNAFWNFGVGVIYNPITTARETETNEIQFRLSNNPLPTDLKNMTYNLSTIPRPLNFELLTEIRGVVMERLELSLYIKSIFSSANQFRNSYSITFFNEKQINLKQNLISPSLLFGIQAQINSPKFYKYYSKVD
jgi:hypothetical protein